MLFGSRKGSIIGSENSWYLSSAREKEYFSILNIKIIMVGGEYLMEKGKGNDLELSVPFLGMWREVFWVIL